MAQVVDEVEAEQEHVQAEERVEADAARGDGVEGRADQPRRDRRAPGHQQQLQRVRAEGRHRGEHLGRMMDLVEFPQQRHVVQQAMRGEPAEIVGDEKTHGVEDANRNAVARRPRRGIGQAERGVDESGQLPLVDDQEREQRRQHQGIDEVQAVISPRRAMPPQAAAEVFAPELVQRPAPYRERENDGGKEERPIQVRLAVQGRAHRLREVEREVMQQVVHSRPVYRLTWTPGSTLRGGPPESTARSASAPA